MKTITNNTIYINFKYEVYADAALTQWIGYWVADQLFNGGQLSVTDPTVVMV